MDFQQQTPPFLLDSSLYCQEECCFENEDFEQTTHQQPFLLNHELFWEEDELSSLFEKEQLNELCNDLENDQILAQSRGDMVDWILKVVGHYSFSSLTALLAVNYFDRFLFSFEFQKDKLWMIQLLVVSCLSLAAKMEETDVPLLLDLQRSWESRPEGVYFRGNQFVIKFGKLCPDMPGIWKEQVEAWKTIVNDVHEKGGIFFCQIWHKGFKPDYNQEKFIFAGGIETHYQVSSEVSLTPHHLTTEDMSGIIHDFRVAALNAMEAGFNWVEIHSVNGYLMENEVYGGSLENHCRLALEVVEAVANEIGAEKVGVKLSPFYDSNGTGVSLWKC